MPYGFMRITLTLTRLKKHGLMNEIINLETVGQNILSPSQKIQDPCFHSHIRRVFISVLLKVRGLVAAVLCFRSVWNITQSS